MLTEKKAIDYWSEGVEFFKSKKWKKALESYEQGLDTLGDFALDKSIVFTLLNENSVKNSNETKVIYSLLDKYLNTDENIKLILKEIKRHTKSKKHEFELFYSKFLLEKDYEKYINIILDIIAESDYYYNFSEYFSLIKGDDKIIDFLVRKLKNFSDGTKTLDNSFFEQVKLFLETEEITESFREACELINNNTRYYWPFVGFCAEFNTTLDKKNKFLSKLIKLSFLLESGRSFEKHVKRNLNTYLKFNKNNIDNLLKFGMSLDNMTVSFLNIYSNPYIEKNYTYIGHKDLWRVYLLEVVTMNFDSIIENLDKYSDNKKTLADLVPVLWESDNDLSLPHILKLANLNSKQVTDMILYHLANYEDGIEEFETMLKSKKQAVRIIGVKLLASIENSDKVSPILKALLKKEKAAKVRAVIEEYLEGIE